MKYAVFFGIGIVVLLVVGIYGCRSGLFNMEPFVDAHYDEEGNVVLEDTPRMWRDYVDSIERRLARELEGRKPDAGIATWNEYWLWRIDIMPAKENRQKYINYIIERRRQEGLPELVERED